MESKIFLDLGTVHMNCMPKEGRLKKQKCGIKLLEWDEYVNVVFQHWSIIIGKGGK